ncbi:MAG: class I SAM-dependent methyltransferase [Elusimicrobia bacterium]|nr:class I SAM-dependent methyltransferase [Elusimicrobiota bacterium]
MKDSESQNISQRQRNLYISMHEEYEAHYYDAMSMKYRNLFFLDPLLSGLDFNGKKVADLACGSGHNSKEVLKRFPRVDIMGFDISPAACKAYKEVVGRPSYELDLTLGSSPLRDFDAAMMIGGLHHCASNLKGTLKTISSLLKPGATFLMMEPSSDFFLQTVREVWYKNDRHFDASTEQALCHDQILSQAQPWFSLKDVCYTGGPGYFLVYNSLLFRMPQPIKKIISPPIILLEKYYNKLPGKRIFPCFISRWTRTHQK